MDHFFLNKIKYDQAALTGGVFWMISWDLAQKPLSFFVALFGLLGTATGFFFAVRKWLSARPRVKRIVRPDDKDLLAIWSIHQREFIDEVADGFRDLQRWLEEAAEARKHPDQKLDEFLLCVKASGKVLGYLFAQYYIKRQMIFVSYIAIDRTSPEAKKADVVARLFRELFKRLEKRRYQWRGIVAEFEVQKIGHIEPHAQRLMAVFQLSLAKLRDLYDRKSNLYRICIDYKQPILRPEDVGKVVIDASYDQWLVFIPRNKEKMVLTVEPGKEFIEKSLVLDVLNLVLLETYLDAFPGDESYKEYLEAEFDKYVRNLPDRVSLWSRFRFHEPNEREKAKELLGLNGTSGVSAVRPISSN